MSRIAEMATSAVTNREKGSLMEQILSSDNLNKAYLQVVRNKGAQQAILIALDMMNEGNDWIVDIDLEKFFDTVNHD